MRRGKLNSQLARCIRVVSISESSWLGGPLRGRHGNNQSRARSESSAEPPEQRITTLRCQALRHLFPQAIVCPFVLNADHRDVCSAIQEQSFADIQTKDRLVLIAAESLAPRMAAWCCPAVQETRNPFGKISWPMPVYGLLLVCKHFFR